VANEGEDQVPPAEAGRVDTYDLFLSYAGEDREIAEDLAEALRGTGFNVWYDKFQLRAGDRLLARINEGLMRSESPQRSPPLLPYERIWRRGRRRSTDRHGTAQQYRPQS
jgi:hypothetical protein